MVIRRNSSSCTAVLESALPFPLPPALSVGAAEVTAECEAAADNATPVAESDGKESLEKLATRGGRGGKCPPPVDAILEAIGRADVERLSGMVPSGCGGMLRRKAGSALTLELWSRVAARLGARGSAAGSAAGVGELAGLEGPAVEGDEGCDAPAFAVLV
jgi:hypothetical protein